MYDLHCWFLAALNRCSDASQYKNNSQVWGCCGQDFTAALALVSTSYSLVAALKLLFWGWESCEFTGVFETQVQEEQHWPG